MVIKRTSTTSSKKASSSKGSSGSSNSNCQCDYRSLVAKKAYELYAKRGYSHGNDLGDWLEAEKSVKSSTR